jgi:hypothetical protein
LKKQSVHGSLRFTRRDKKNVGHDNPRCLQMRGQFDRPKPPFFPCSRG